MLNPISETTSGYLSTLRNEKYASLLPSLLYTILKIDFSGDVYLSASNVSLSIIYCGLTAVFIVDLGFVVKLCKARIDFSSFDSLIIDTLSVTSS